MLPLTRCIPSAKNTSISCLFGSGCVYSSAFPSPASPVCFLRVHNLSIRLNATNKCHTAYFHSPYGNVLCSHDVIFITILQTKCFDSVLLGHWSGNNLVLFAFTGLQPHTIMIHNPIIQQHPEEHGFHFRVWLLPRSLGNKTDDILGIIKRMVLFLMVLKKINPNVAYGLFMYCCYASSTCSTHSVNGANSFSWVRRL